MTDAAPGDRRRPLSGGSARGVVLAAAGTALVVAILFRLGPSTVSASATGPGASGAPPVTTSVTSTTTVAAVASTTTTVPAHDRSTVTVQVANGTSAPHAAGSLSTTLTGQGWKLLAPRDTTSTTTSSVYYAPGYSTDAAAVAQAAGMSGAAIRPMSASPVTTSADVLVIIGTDQPGSSTG